MGKFFMISLAIFAATGSFLFGYDSGVMTDVIQSPHFLTYFNTSKTSPIIGAINSTFSGGAVFGSLMGGFTMDRLGRKWTIMIGAMICFVGAILQAAAVHLAMMLVGRIMAGWAVGLMSMSVPVYQSECAHPKIRGLVVGMAQQMIGVGFIVSTWIGYGAAHVPATNAFSWRFPLAFQTVPCVILLIGLPFFPESPRHLMEHGEEDEAMRVLNKLHYDGTNQEWIQSEFEEIRSTISAEKAITAPGWLVMFKVPQWRNRLLQATLVQVFTQMTGYVLPAYTSRSSANSPSINVIGYYQTIMYEFLGITGQRNLLVTGIYNCVGPFANLIFIVFILDRLGRRIPLLVGTVAITIALICEAAINSQIPQPVDGEVIEAHSGDGKSIAGVFFIFCVTVIFSGSFGSISWVYMSEIMPMQIRGRGSAFATGIGNWLVSTIWSQVSPIGLGAITWKYYFIFIAFNILITFPTIYFTFKETKQMSLEEIDLLFGGRALGTLPEDLDKDVVRDGSVTFVAEKETKLEA
ncbi:MFS sugar transporter-like protein [Eremomyces bilateralis CBS 781.70]|uniref:MFS sugar transporter-like protein n=1 Tax=Eremomyces bilateralis CBS 781.70 TaxID=1392243 RepID=A0A6G1G1S7_9PEZI|nr:MFS sugar transporter-like protein [Eremomyces bilateralis CBS 781.70]KAF1812065.1 MFS sugar transporter-like protein [Eremomyces bilateralis CBS 781.70]